MKRKIFLAIVVVIVFAQIFQPTKNFGSMSESSDIHHTLQIPPTISAILKQSCYDCHSNLTNYPWYANLTPVNWWIAGHVNEGKAELNFSVFSNYSAQRQIGLLKEIAETVKSDKMPLSSYLKLHSDARLSAHQKAQVFDWALNSSMKLAVQK